MPTSANTDESRVQRNADERLLKYEKYAPQFDEMNSNNPAYDELLNILELWLPKFDLDDESRICDLGAGTGNFITRMAESLPDSHYVHLDMDANMNSLAIEKYDNHGVRNCVVLESLIQNADFEAQTFDLILCVNALNTAPPQLETLKLINRWLTPGGSVFLVDFGRVQDMVDWSMYFVRHTIRKYGIRHLLTWAWNCREAFKQNRLARRDQLAGSMWLHSGAEFQNTVRKAGFDIRHAQECYRGYADLVIGTRPHEVCQQEPPLLDKQGSSVPA